MNLITTTDDLAAFCRRAAALPYVTVDTEFMRETTYYPRLCLIQMAAGDEGVIVDPQAPGIALDPFLDLMRGGDTVKVFHAARQDLEILWNLGRFVPKPLFDTQIAAMVCGYGDQVSYEQLANDFARARVDKSQRFTDWSRRPLAEAQLEYALADVTHLRQVYEGLCARLEDNSRTSWLDDEMAILNAPSTYSNEPDQAWRRLAGRVRKPRDLGVLMHVAAWRELEAQARDVPRQRVLKDDALIEVVNSAPTSMEQLSRLRALPGGYERSRPATDLLAAVKCGLDMPRDSLPSLPRNGRATRSDAAADLLKTLLRIIAQEHGVAAKIIATSDDIDALASGEIDPNAPAMTGWRRELFGEPALALLEGRIGLALKRGRATIVEAR